MKLIDFINKFVEHNSLIRLVYKTNEGHETIAHNWDYVCMEHAIKKDKIYGQFINNNVVAVTDIYITGCRYPEAINIVIEK